MNEGKVDRCHYGVLMEAMGPGNAIFIKNGEFRTWFRGANGLIQQARRQILAAQGIPIEWHIAEKTAADLISILLKDAGYGAIKIIVTLML